jgi:hypothetical protein
MAATGYLELLLNTLPDEIRKPMVSFVREAFKTISVGAPSTSPVACVNMRGNLVPFTTSGSSGVEVAVAHGLGRKPGVLMPALDPNTVNATMPPLTVTRACDDTYLYISSTTLNASGHLYVE